MWSNDTVKASMTAKYVVRIFNAPTIPRTMDLEVDDGHNPRISMIYSVRLHTGGFLSHSCFQGCFRWPWPGPMIVHPWFALFPCMEPEKKKKKKKREKKIHFSLWNPRAKPLFHFPFPHMPHPSSSAYCHVGTLSLHRPLLFLTVPELVFVWIPPL